MPKPVKAKSSSPVSLSPAIMRKPSSKSASPTNSSSSPPMSSDHLCAHCGSSAVQIKYVTRSFGKAAALLVIEAIPMYACPDCGESYFSAQTLHEIERIKALRKSVAVSRSIPVAAFQPAAA
ncbi:MAG: type II toxin-antitoxin system MqsA family antitoxin [Sulfuritalea sp.]|nr:type II toxin-antitoxin system MqsA family antitoxin [Sulfuritalea sp.]